VTVANTKPRDLAAIATEIRAKMLSVTDVIEIGGLLIEAQDHLKHGEWIPWVARELDFSERSAQHYMAVYRFSLKYETVADLKFTLSALYDLASYDYSEPEVEAVLAVAAQERVTSDRLVEIVASLEPDEDDQDLPESEHDPDCESLEARESAALAAEAVAILDGPPPDLPPTEDAPAADFVTPAFNQAIDKLTELSTKPLAKFKNAAALSKVVAVAEFLQHVAGRAGGEVDVSADDDPVVEDFAQEWARSKVKQMFEAATTAQRVAIISFIAESPD
jgi:hypothetical protein